MVRSGFVRWRRGPGLRDRFGVADSSAPLLTIAARFLLTLGMVALVHAEGGSRTVLNGSIPRPFYVVAHNPNTVQDAANALAAGMRSTSIDAARTVPNSLGNM